MKKYFIISLMLILCRIPVRAQEDNDDNTINAEWLVLQTLPSVAWTSLSDETHFAFEWEAAPLIYSFGMNKHVSPLHSFFVTQPERFAGSIEFVCSAQVYPFSINGSHWGFSGQVLGHIPVIEHGEYFGLTIGYARYTIAGLSSNYIVVGGWTLFGFLHYNIKRSTADDSWMHSIELRFF